VREAHTLKIVVDRGKCIAAANCIGMAPKVFALDGQKKSIVIDAKGADDPTIVEAAEVCPTEAIQLLDEETGEQIFP
jgi:ferredoxin